MKNFIRKVSLKTGLLMAAFRIYQSIKAAELGRRDAEYLGKVASDGLPIPPPKLIVLAGGHTNVPAFLGGGKAVAQIILDALKRNGLNIDDFQAILDFGCGCGRVTRQWKSLKRTDVYGTDYNAEPIAWCRRNLTFAQFEINQLSPPMSYGAGSFDFVYAISVFTHMSEAHQILWINELSRVLKLGGYLLITTHGEDYREKLTETEKEAFEAGQFVVRHEEATGTNLCAAFHPEKYVREKLAGGFTVVDFIPGAIRQDIYLLRKPMEVSS